MIALRLRLRRDGSLCLTDVNGRVTGPDRYFPEDHFFTYDFLARNAQSVTLTGDVLVLALANAVARYSVGEHAAGGIEVHLEDAELFDAPPIDEAAAGALAATRSVVNSGEAAQANAGQAVVEG